MPENHISPLSPLAKPGVAKRPAPACTVSPVLHSGEGEGAQHHGRHLPALNSGLSSSQAPVSASDACQRCTHEKESRGRPRYTSSSFVSILTPSDSSVWCLPQNTDAAKMCLQYTKTKSQQRKHVSAARPTGHQPPGPEQSQAKGGKPRIFLPRQHPQLPEWARPRGSRAGVCSLFGQYLWSGCGTLHLTVLEACTLCVLDVSTGGPQSGSKSPSGTGVRPYATNIKVSVSCLVQEEGGGNPPVLQLAPLPAIRPLLPAQASQPGLALAIKGSSDPSALLARSKLLSSTRAPSSPSPTPESLAVPLKGCSKPCWHLTYCASLPVAVPCLAM